MFSEVCVPSEIIRDQGLLGGIRPGTGEKGVEAVIAGRSGSREWVMCPWLWSSFLRFAMLSPAIMADVSKERCEGLMMGSVSEQKKSRS